MTSVGEQDRMVSVRVVGLPLDLYVRSQEHHEGLVREFALISAGEWEPPGRLRQLIEDLRARFEGFLSQPTGEREAALARGDQTVDLTYHVPAIAGEACIQLDRLLDEVDEYCRRGQLLTLETPAELVSYRRWFLRQFIDQVDGRPPTPWPQWQGDQVPG